MNEAAYMESLSVQQLSDLAESFGYEAMCLLDRHGDFLTWNPGAVRCFGYAADEMIHVNGAALFADPNIGAKQLAAGIECARKRGSSRSRFIMHRKDGSTFPALVEIAAIRNRADFRFSAFDNSAMEARARELREHAAHVRSFLRTVPIATLVLDEDGLVEASSEAAAVLFDYSEEEMIGLPVATLLFDGELEWNPGAIPECLRDFGDNAQPKATRMVGRRINGSTFPLSITVGRGESDGKPFFTAFMRDLTGSEKADAKLRELQADLLRNSRISAVGTLSAALAHELNQPLTAVTNYVQTAAELLRTDKNAISADELAEILNCAGSEAVRAGEIVRRLRRFIARGELRRTRVDVTQMAEQACAIAAIDARARGISCEISISMDAGRIVADAIQIQQVLLNLVRNAIEAVERNGRIEIHAHKEGAFVRFTVSDDGPGLAQSNNLFEPLKSDKEDGMGLGLSISRTIVETHGGKLWFEPNKPSGTQFHFTIPADGHDAAGGA